MKTLVTAYGTVQPVPSAAASGVSQPLPPDGTLPPAMIQPGDRFTTAFANKNDGLTTKRAHANAPLSGRLPVQATRCQDHNPTANDGVTITTENGVKIAAKGSTLR